MYCSADTLSDGAVKLRNCRCPAAASNYNPGRPAEVYCLIAFCSLQPSGMTYQNFRDSQTQPELPTGPSPLPEARRYAGRDEWHQAHTIARQHEADLRFDWLHAFLHRRQGDLGLRPTSSTGTYALALLCSPVGAPYL